MSAAEYWIGLTGPTIYTTGLVAAGLGYFLSRRGISFGENLWNRIDQLKRTKYFWSRLSWGVTRYLTIATFVIWAIIAISVLIFCIWPESLIREAVQNTGLPAGVSVPTYTAAERQLLWSLPAAILIGFVISALVVYLDRLTDDMVPRFPAMVVSFFSAVLLTVIVLFVVAVCALTVFIAIKVHWVVGVQILPVLTNEIVSHYNAVRLGQLAAFGIVSMAVYPVPILGAVLGLYLTFTGLLEVAELIGLESDLLWGLTDWFESPLQFLATALPGAFASIFWTLLMLVFGNYVQHETVAVSLQLLISNAIFDGLTIYFAIVILTWAAFQYRLTVRLRNLNEALVDLREQINQDRKAKEVGAVASNMRSSRKFATPRTFFWRSVMQTSTYLAALMGEVENSSEVEESPSKDNVKLQKSRLRFVKLFFDLIMFVGSQRVQKSVPGLTYVYFGRDSSESQVAEWALANETLWRPVVETILDRSWWRAVPAFVANFFTAAILSCLALFFSFWRTQNELSIDKVWWTFTGGYSGNKLTELGPLFWVTHSTFLPTLFLWVVILLLFVSAFIVNPIGNVIVRFGRATLSNPKSGLLKYGLNLIAIGEGFDMLTQFVMRALFPGMR